MITEKSASELSFRQFGNPRLITSGGERLAILLQKNLQPCFLKFILGHLPLS